MLSVHTNYASLVGQNSLNRANGDMTTAMERLSTGFRINGASDDAAGLQIASRLEADSVALNQGMRNVNDGVAMLETADGALSEVESIGMRMTELATQYGNGTLSADDKTAVETEFNALKAEVGDIMTKTEFAGEKLLEGGKVGSGAITIDAGVGRDVSVNAKVNMDKLIASYGALDITTVAPGGPEKLVDGMLADLGNTRADLGAGVNRLQHTASNNANIDEGTQQALGTIKDADFAVESSNMTKNQMLVQAGTNVLSRANQNTSLVMSLLG
ncbi:flagellin [uncultured Ferrimonas sp.]|uniref:flagellin N-terminal helical domain-containing protein n=1 Tax=uncultured Ferrimonas sp. TaxID=432640 RepID=UPI0026073EBB|nr:flagellin [uncultured Ferrimonas sp.]